MEMDVRASTAQASSTTEQVAQAPAQSTATAMAPTVLGRVKKEMTPEARASLI
jgi:hypothetical protein